MIYSSRSAACLTVAVLRSRYCFKFYICAVVSLPSGLVRCNPRTSASLRIYLYFSNFVP